MMRTMSEARPRLQRPPHGPAHGPAHGPPRPPKPPQGPPIGRWRHQQPPRRRLPNPTTEGPSPPRAPRHPGVDETRHHGAMPTFDDALRSIDDRFARLREEKLIPGIAWGVIRDGELVHAGGSGTIRDGEDRVPDADTVFRIASMTKSFTAATILLLRDEGRLRLDDPVGDTRAGACRLGAAHERQRAGHDPPAAHDVGRPGHGRSLGRSPAGPAARPVRGAAGGRPHLRVAAGDGLRLLEPGIRDPGPRHHERRGRRVPRGRAGPPAAAAGHDLYHLSRGGGPGGDPGPRLRPSRRGPGPRGEGPVRRARLDGRGVLLGARPRALGRRVPGRVPGPLRSRGSAPAPARVAARDAAGPARLRDGGSRRCPGRGAGRVRRRLRVRAVHRHGPGPRHGREPLGRVPGLRVQHGLAPGDRVGGDRPREPPLRAGRWRVGRGAGSAWSGRVTSRGARCARRPSWSGSATWPRACSRAGTTLSRTRRSR